MFGISLENEGHGWSKRAVRSQLVGYLDENGLMPRNQSFYRLLQSIDTAMAVIFILDDGNLALTTLLDLSTAFDCVHHDIILR